MRQALILGGVPRLNILKVFPRVPLGPGNWRIDVEHRVDTVLSLLRYTRVALPESVGQREKIETDSAGLDGKVIAGPIEVAIEIKTAGDESFINVFATSL